MTRGFSFPHTRFKIVPFPRKQYTTVRIAAWPADFRKKKKISYSVSIGGWNNRGIGCLHVVNFRFRFIFFSVYLLVAMTWPPLPAVGRRFVRCGTRVDARHRSADFGPATVNVLPESAAVIGGGGGRRRCTYGRLGSPVTRGGGRFSDRIYVVRCRRIVRGRAAATGGRRRRRRSDKKPSRPRSAMFSERDLFVAPVQNRKPKITNRIDVPKDFSKRAYYIYIFIYNWFSPARAVLETLRVKHNNNV